MLFWFQRLLVIFSCEYYNESLQLRWWEVLLACALAISSTLPVCIISATTSQSPGLNILTEYIIGYAYPGRPVVNMCFKVYGYISMKQALNFLADFKLGHYMKIPPRTMFMALVCFLFPKGLGYSCSSDRVLINCVGLMESITHLCDTSVLSLDSHWRCPMDVVFFDASVIWGLIGPEMMFGDLGLYSKVNYFFVIGAGLQVLVWLAHKALPNHKWITLINFPVLHGATAMMPSESAVNFTSWIVLAFLSGFFVFRRWPSLWERYNYVLSGSLDAGTVFLSLLLFLCSAIERHLP